MARRLARRLANEGWMTSGADGRSSRSSSYDIDKFLNIYEIEDADLERIREFGKGPITRLDRFNELFFGWVRPQPEYEMFFSDPDRLAHAQKMQIRYWEQFFKADVNEDYLASRRTVGRVHFELGLTLNTFVSAMNKSLGIMVDDLYEAFDWLHANAEGFGGNPERIHVIGHSSGAHLTGVLLTTDWTALGLPADILKSATCVSGIYDMHPVLLSARSSYVELSSEEEDRLSAIRHADRIACPVVVAYGSLESPEFKRHGRTFAAALREVGVLHEETVLEGKNHFEGIRTMMDPETPLARVVFSMVAEAP